MAQRPPPSIRVLVLLVAIVALFSAVCAHSRTAEPQRANPDASAADAGTPAAQQPPQDKEYFPASKAPGFLYRP